MGDWFQKGKAGRQKAKQEDQAAKKRRESTGQWRFRLKNDESAKIVFVDNPDFYLHEHTIRISAKNFENETCIKEADICTPCENGEIPSYEVAATIIDTRVWEDKEGQTRRNMKRLGVFKGKARQALLREVDRRDGDLTGCVYEVARGPGQTECATGEDFAFLKRLSKAEMKKLMPKGEKKKAEWLDPLDYEKEFAPKTAKELRKLYGGEAAMGDEEDTTSDEDDGGVSDAGGDFDEAELREELEEKNLKGLRKYVKDNELEVTIKNKDDDAEVIDRIVEAVRKSGGAGEGEAGDEDAKGKDDQIDIDDLI